MRTKRRYLPIKYSLPHFALIVGSHIFFGQLEDGTQGQIQDEEDDPKQHKRTSDQILLPVDVISIGNILSKRTDRMLWRFCSWAKCSQGLHLYTFVRYELRTGVAIL